MHEGFRFYFGAEDLKRVPAPSKSKPRHGQMFGFLHLNCKGTIITTQFIAVTTVSSYSTSNQW